MLAQAPVGKETVLSGSIEPMSGGTPASWGNLPAVCILVVAAHGLLALEAPRRQSLMRGFTATTAAIMGSCARQPGEDQVDRLQRLHDGGGGAAVPGLLPALEPQ